jgi:hypothetical protein
LLRLRLRVRRRLLSIHQLLLRHPLLLLLLLLVVPRALVAEQRAELGLERAKYHFAKQVSQQGTQLP